jgi:CBS domain-containing protein
MVTLRHLLEEKEGRILHLSPAATVYEAIRMMGEHNVGALLVMEDGRLVGIVSERDYARKVILKGKKSSETTVREIMTEKVRTVESNRSILECMQLMTENHFRHLPVMEDGKLAGVISIGDVVKAVITDQQETIDMLKNYISGHS